MSDFQLTPDQHQTVKAHTSIMQWLAQEEARVQTELQHLQMQRQRAQAQLEQFISQTFNINLKDENWNLDVEKGTLTNGPADK